MRNGSAAAAQGGTEHLQSVADKGIMINLDPKAEEEQTNNQCEFNGRGHCRTGVI